MSEFRVDQITNQSGSRGPDIAGITTFSATSGMIMPSGDTKYRYFYGKENIIQDNLVIWLDAANIKSYDGSGTTWINLSDNNNIGILHNGVTFYDYNSGYFVFDGKDDYASINTSSYPSGNFSFTVSTFIKWNGPASGNQLIFTFGADGSNEAIILWINNSSYAELQFGSDTGKVVSKSPIEVGKWYNICAVYDTNKTKIYVNGLLEGTTPYSAANITLNDNVSGNNASFGRFPSNFAAQVLNPPGYGSYNGIISQFLFYNRSLSDVEILQNYNALRYRYGV